uniref:Uncharacterized protein ycf23 n=1 Tax=Digenea simplex TaxID=945030 RepID=A0A1Z1MUS9_DIGSM|nr:hypothetical protein [Digenea simplex]ARW69485.1 hypothetical protein [Digenea simplex]
MKLFNTKLNKLFDSNCVIKVIAGINNSNISQIVKIAKAAEMSKGTYIDIIANPGVVKVIKSISSIPICVSSINPIDLYNCVLAGADLVEIGNFDTFYSKGIYLSRTKILQLAQEVKFLVPYVDVCVTIPYHLSLNDQVNLAQDLESLGISILQTEGLSTKNKLDMLSLYKDIICDSISKSSFSFLSTYIISQKVTIPVIASSSIKSLSSSVAIFYGASGIGIGSSINKKNDLFDMCTYIDEVHHSLSFRNSSYLIHQNLHSSMSLYSFFL